MKKQATGSGKAFFSKLGTSCNIQVRRADDDSEYRILPRTIVEMVGRELEYHQYREITALNDAEAEEARQKQQELIDFVFSKP